MDILVVTIFYAPDGGPSAPLFTMLCEEMARLGHNVTVIPAVPHYPTGQVRPEFRHGWFQRNDENGVHVVRVQVPSVDRSRFGRRLLQFLAYQIGATWAGLGKRYSVILVTNPALITITPMAVLAALRRKPAVFSVHDVYPEVGVELGIFRHKIVARTVAALERFCLNQSQYVRILSTSFKPPLLAMGVPEDKLVLIYDWIDTDFVRPLPRANAFSAENGLDDSFVVLYAGNIGLSQGLEHVLHAAQTLTDRPQIRFVLVGDGAGREPLVAMAEAMHLDNVQFIPFQPRERVPEVLATADISLVSLQPQVSGRSLPSKTFSYLASGRPIIAMVDEGSDVWNLIAQARAGLCIPPADPDKLVEAILTLEASTDLRQQMANAGRAYAEQHHSHRQAAQQFVSLLTRAAERR